MYHRIASAVHDQWELSVSPKNFEEHLQVLQQYKVIALPELVNQWGNQKLANKSIAISFDDGYIDNYTTAKPLLEKYKLPATFFITNGNVDKQAEFWWDELENIFMNDHGKYMEYWKQLLPMPYQQQQQLLSTLRNNNQVRAAYTCMSSRQIQELAKHELFTIGAHTVNHIALAHQPSEIQKQEITQNIEWLQSLTGKAPALLAYPYGNYNEATINIASQRGLAAAFTTEGQPIAKHSARYQLARFQVKNWNGFEFEEHLRAWLKM